MQIGCHLCRRRSGLRLRQRWQPICTAAERKGLGKPKKDNQTPSRWSNDRFGLNAKFKQALKHKHYDNRRNSGTQQAVRKRQSLRTLPHQQVPRPQNSHTDVHGHTAHHPAARRPGPAQRRGEDHQERRSRARLPLRQRGAQPVGGHLRAWRDGSNGDCPHRLRGTANECHRDARTDEGKRHSRALRRPDALLRSGLRQVATRLRRHGVFGKTDRAVAAPAPPCCPKTCT